MFCIGKIGEEPRLYMQTPDEAEAYLQRGVDEICFQTPDTPQIPPIKRYKIEVNASGPTLVPAKDPLQVMQDWFWAEAKKWREVVMNGGLNSSAGPVDTGNISQIRISTMATSALADDSFTVDWTMRDNSVKTLSAPELINLNIEVSNFLAAVQAAGTNIRTQIDAAKSQSELEAIDIFAGYPSESLIHKENN